MHLKMKFPGSMENFTCMPETQGLNREDQADKVQFHQKLKPSVTYKTSPPTQ